MDPLSITASIIAILQVTTALVNYANDVKDAPKDRARFAMEASSLSSLLLNLRYQIEDERCEKSNEAWTREVTLLGVPDGPLDQYRHALEKLQLKIVSGKGLVKIGDALWWRFTKEEVAGILLRIERLKSLIQIALQIDHFKLSQAIKTRLDEIYDDNEEVKLDMGVVRSQIPALQDGVGAIQDSVDAVQRDQDRQKNQVLVEWLSPAKYSSQQSDFIARRQPGTGQWFLDSPEFNNWLCEPSHTLFCPGIPGAGKTMVSAIAVDHLHKLTDSGYAKHCEVAQIFCNYKTQSEQNTTSLLSAILKQLVQAKPSAAKAASILYDRHSSHGTRPSLDEIFAALKTTMMSFWTVYVVIDALDECADRDGTRSQFLGKLRDLQQEFDVRLMVTSRANTDIVGQFKSSPMLEIRASPADVKKYVRGQIHRLPRCVQRDEKLHGEVEDKIVEAVDGMFLLARLHVDSLRDKRTKAKVQSMLEMLPRGAEALKEAYNDAIKRIETQLLDDSKLAKSVLSWITYAERPLTTGEICHALAVDPGDTDLNEDNILDIEDIVSVCAGLVTVDEESNIVRLVHYTTQEYFLQIREAWNPTAQQQITTTCLTYLSFGSFRGGSCDEDVKLEERFLCYAFLDYASRYWGNHAQMAQEQVSELAFAFLRDNKLVSCALQAMSGHGYTFTNYAQTFPKYATGVHLTAKFGLEYLLAGLLSGSGGASTMAANSTDRYGRTPLAFAASEGHTAIMRLLVERDDVDLDSKDIYGRTPLSSAALEGREAAVKLLLGLDGVGINTKDKRGRTPLSWASYRGNRAVAELLMEQEEAEIDVGDKEGITPFLWAVQGGAESTVEMFLERKDIDFNMVDNNCMTPLVWAARLGHEVIVKLLLEHADIEVNLTDTNYQTALSKAALQGHEAIVRLLLENEDVVAEVDVGNFHGRTPLSYAAEGGNEATVKLLVERADVNADSKDNNGRTPLWWAARAQNEEIIKLLIEREDVAADSKSLDDQTPLLYAARLGNGNILKLFLARHDVNVNSTDKDDLTPLAWAAMEGHEEIVKLLLERSDVKPDIPDTMGQTPLMWAAELGYEAIVSLLLGREDVDPTLKNSVGDTALSWAEQRGRKGVVKLLMERKDVKAGLKDDYHPKDKDSQAELSWAMRRRNWLVKANIPDGDGLTPLSWAAKAGHAAIVKLLLERKDIEADIKDKNGQTPLSWAARGQGRSESVVELLLGRHDVDANSTDKEGLTPLSWAIERGNSSIAKLLLRRHDVDVNVKDKGGESLLSRTVRRGDEPHVKLLLGRHDLDTNSMDKERRTPLSWAVQGERLYTVQSYNDYLKSMDKKGQAPLSKTEFWRMPKPLPEIQFIERPAIVQLLLEREDIKADFKGDRGQTPLMQAIGLGFESVVRLLIAREDVDVNSEDDRGMTPLMYAAFERHETIVKLLLEKGVDTMGKSNLGWTALSIAAGTGHEAVVQLILEWWNGEADSKDEFGHTPLWWAAEGGHEGTVRLLLERDGVEADVKNAWGNQTPLMCAAHGGYEAIVKLLWEREDVDPVAKNDFGQTALWLAEKSGHTGVVEFLRQKLDHSEAKGDGGDESRKGNKSQSHIIITIPAITAHVSPSSHLVPCLTRHHTPDDPRDSPKPNEPSWPSPADRRGITVASLTLLSSDQLSLQQHLDLSSSILSYLPDTAEGEPQPLIMAQAVPNPPSGRKRVKVYELRNNDWFDRGTGFAIASSTWDHADGEPRIIVEAEEGPERLLLETQISRQGGFAKQQETLIIWTEPVNGVDMALSFQESDGCTAIWKFINMVQQQMVVNGGPEDALSEDMAPETAPVNLPVPDINNLKEVELEMRHLNNTQAGRDALAKFVIHDEYIPKLVPLIEEAEAAHRLGELHRLCNIMKMLILLNDNDIIEYAMTDEVFLGVMGALEYDPDFPSHKANHRQWLGDESRYKEVVRIDDDQVRRKIHHTYRLQYLKDVALARVLDDPTFSILNSLIFYYQVDIIQHIQGNPAFLNDLFAIFGPEEKDEKRKKDAVLFIQQCCAIAKNFQPPARNSLYNNFLNHGLLAVINYALAHNDVAVRVGATDVLVSVIDHDPQMIRQTIFRQISEKQRPLTDSLIDLLLVEVDLGVKAQIADAIKVLLDPGSQQGPQEGMAKLGMEFGGRGRPQVDPQQEGFLAKFYEESAKKLFSPLVELKDKENLSFNVQQVSLFEHLIEILWFFIRQHQHRSKYFVLAESLGQRIAQLLSCPEKHLKLTALKFFRNLLGLNDEFYNQQMIQEHLLEPILNTLLDTMPRNNLLNSACLDFFEYIRNHGVPIMVNHLVERYRDKIQDIQYVDTFTALISRFDHASQGYASNMDASFLDTEDEGPGGRSQPGDGRRWQGVRDLDPTEEQYFNTSDDEDDVAGAKSPPSASVNGASPLSKPLVDYASDEEADMTDAELAGILPSREAGSPPAPEKEAERKSASPPPPERLSEKRRREEDEEDEIAKLAGQQSKRRNSSSSVVSVGSNGSTPMLRRKKSFNGSRDGGGGGGGGGKKISISLAPAIKSGGDGGSGADDGS
ncbi:hypothetical protein VE03_06864 [Pseudogymnoascus sp. 23342-1-I1]|nr:hypothetical protein VE03_06864 [Pseudogymnoascus sp. 23342-1-I1]